MTTNNGQNDGEGVASGGAAASEGVTHTGPPTAADDQRAAREAANREPEASRPGHNPAGPNELGRMPVGVGHEGANEDALANEQREAEERKAGGLIVEDKPSHTGDDDSAFD